MGEDEWEEEEKGFFPPHIDCFLSSYSYNPPPQHDLSDQGCILGPSHFTLQRSMPWWVLLSIPRTPCGSRGRMQIPASTLPEITQKLSRNYGSLASKE